MRIAPPATIGSLGTPNTQISSTQFDSRPVPDPTILTTQQMLRETAALRELFESRLEGIDKTIEHLQNGAAKIPTEISTATKAVRELIETRILAMDKAIVLLESTDKLVAPWMDDKVNGLQLLHEEKFIGIQHQFSERDMRFSLAGNDNKVAISAALQATKEYLEEKFRAIAVQLAERKEAVDVALDAAKEAVSEQNKSNALAIAKSEAAFTKQIDQNVVFVNAMSKGIDEKIEDIKARQTTLLTRVESTAVTAGIAERVAKIESTIANYEGRMMMVGLLAAAIPTVVTVLLHFLR